MKLINYANSYNTLDMDNKKYKKEIESLKKKNTRLETENNYLIDRLEAVFKAIKKFFRKLLQIGNEIVKNAVSSEIKNYYDNNDMAIRTTKEDELFDYANILEYYKTKKYEDDDYDKYDYEIDDEYEEEIDKDADFELSR